MKKVLYLLMFFVVIFGLSACDKNQVSQDKDVAFENREFRRPDFGQPERNADISGLIKSIIGNEVTILKIERPERNEGEENGIPDKNGSDEKDTEKASTQGFGGMSGGMRGMGGGMRSSGSLDTDAQAAMLEKMKVMSTGEEKVLIPVGIKMLKPDIENMGTMEMVEATLNDIVKDKMINIWLDENSDDRNIASFVLIKR